MATAPTDPTPGVPYHLLDPTEDILAHAEADDGVMFVTGRRLVVSFGTGRFDLDIPLEGLRRIQFDIERRRPSCLVIVPEHPADPPVVLSIPPAQFEQVAEALALVGKALHEISTDESDRVSVEPAGRDGRPNGRRS
jgi:hypothetical protein